MKYTKRELREVLGENAYAMYENLDNYIMDTYNAVQSVGYEKDGTMILAYRCSGKPLCTMFVYPQRLVINIILGKDERSRFEEKRDAFPAAILEKYDLSNTYHDGKWMYFDVYDNGLFEDFVTLLNVKKKPNRKFTMCGYCCEMCKAYTKSIKRKDEREELLRYWKKYYNLEIPIEDMLCDGCRCKNEGALVDKECPIRLCVLEKKLGDCSECDSYPCAKFMSREGINYDDAYKIEELTIDKYYEFLGAFDNKSRMDRKRK